MKKKSQANLDDINFICECIIWYLKKDPKELIEHFKDNKFDALYTIPHPKGGLLICGLEASRRFTDIAKRLLRKQTEKKKRTDLSKFVGNLKEEFSKRFVKHEQEVSRQNIDRMISTAYKRTEKRFEKICHYIPCAIFFTDSIKCFEVGPVKFIHKSHFIESHEAEINDLRNGIRQDHQDRCKAAIRDGYPANRIATEEQSGKIANSLVNGLLDFFRQFDWFSVLEIAECDSKVSYERALFLTKTALNIIKLLLGGQYTDRLRTADDYGHSVKSAKLKRINEKLHISLSNTPCSNVLGDDWLDFLTTKAGYFFNLASQALHLSVGFDNVSPLCTRFIDSVSWYGDAISEKSTAAKIVKFVSSLERMTGTGREIDKDGKERRVDDIVTKRSSILYSIATDESLEQSFNMVSRIYTCRSNLVHGSISPFDDSVVKDSFQAEHISRLVILTGLDYFDSLGLDNHSISQKQLRMHYNNLENQYFK